jgi:hypothetical protein
MEDKNECISCLNSSMLMNECMDKLLKYCLVSCTIEWSNERASMDLDPCCKWMDWWVDEFIINVDEFIIIGVWMVYIIIHVPNWIYSTINSSSIYVI